MIFYRDKVVGVCSICGKENVSGIVLKVHGKDSATIKGSTHRHNSPSDNGSFHGNATIIKATKAE